MLPQQFSVGGVHRVEAPWLWTVFLFLICGSEVDHSIDHSRGRTDRGLRFEAPQQFGRGSLRLTFR